VLDGKFARRDYTFSLVTDVEKNFVTINLDNDAINNVSVIEVLDGLVNGGEEVLSRANVIYGDLWGAGRGRSSGGHGVVGAFDRWDKRKVQG
jgi:hypothetical protein